MLISNDGPLYLKQHNPFTIPFVTDPPLVENSGTIHFEPTAEQNSSLWPPIEELTKKDYRVCVGTLFVGSIDMGY